MQTVCSSKKTRPDPDRWTECNPSPAKQTKKKRQLIVRIPILFTSLSHIQNSPPSWRDRKKILPLHIYIYITPSQTRLTIQTVHGLKKESSCDSVKCILKHFLFYFQTYASELGVINLQQRWNIFVYRKTLFKSLNDIIISQSSKPKNFYLFFCF